MTADLDEAAVEHVYTAPQACHAAGITYRELDYWTHTGRIGRPGRGTGRPQLWSEFDVEKARYAKLLRTAGFDLEHTFTIAHDLATSGAHRATVGGISISIVTSEPVAKPEPPTQGVSA